MFMFTLCKRGILSAVTSSKDYGFAQVLCTTCTRFFFFFFCLFVHYVNGRFVSCSWSIHESFGLFRWPVELESLSAGQHFSCMYSYEVTRMNTLIYWVLILHQSFTLPIFESMNKGKKRLHEIWESSLGLKAHAVSGHRLPKAGHRQPT